MEAQKEVEGGADGHIIELEEFRWRKRGEMCLRGRVLINSVVMNLLDVMQDRFSGLNPLRSHVDDDVGGNQLREEMISNVYTQISTSAMGNGRTSDVAEVKP